MTDGGDALERVKRSLSTKHLIRSRATDWSDESGGDRVGRCTHPEHGHTSGSGGTPNLIVTDDNGWYCYSHETGGGPIEWIAVEEGVTSCRNLPLTDEEFSEVLPAAAERAGVELDDYDSSPDRTQREATALNALDRALDMMHERLDEKVIGGRTVRHKIKEERGFSDDTIDDLKIGYMDPSLERELLETFDKSTLRDIGILRENNSWHITERIIYPYWGGGLPLYWTARKTEESDLDAKYLKPPRDSAVLEQPVFYRKPDRKDTDQLWIVEGIQDAISLSESGVPATAPVATNPSDAQFDRLTQYAEKHESVVIAFDNDDSGKSKANDLALELLNRGYSPQIATLPGDADDPNEHFANGGDREDIETEAAVRGIIDERGDHEHVVKDLLGTVNPDSMRADRMIDEIAAITPYRKRVLRQHAQEIYHQEEQGGWVEPVRIEKTDQVEPEWRFIFPDGSRFRLTTSEVIGEPDAFLAKYTAIQNYYPDIDADRWRELFNDWTEEVAVVEPDMTSTEERVKHKLFSTLEITEAFEDPSEAVARRGVSHTEDADEMLVPSQLVENALDDLDVSMTQIGMYLADYKLGKNKQIRPSEGHARQVVWRFDPDAIREDGYIPPTPGDDRGDDESGGEDGDGGDGDGGGGGDRAPGDTNPYREETDDVPAIVPEDDTDD